MATRYWVGGNGTWNTSSTTHWSSASALTFTASRTGNTLTTTGSPALVNGMTVWDANDSNIGTITGGSGNTWTTSLSGALSSQPMTAATVGASAPTSADDVIFNSALGVNSPTITVGAVVACLNFTASSTGVGIVNFNGTSRIQIYGNFTVSSSDIWLQNQDSSYRCIEMVATTTGKTVQSSAGVLAAISFNGTGGGWTLASNLTAGKVFLVRGTLNTFSANNYSITTSWFFDSDYSGSYGTRVLTLNASTVNITSDYDPFPIFSLSYPTLTLNAGTSEILIPASYTTIYLSTFTLNKVTISNATTYSGFWYFNNGTISQLTFSNSIPVSIYWSGKLTVNTLVVNTSSANRIQIIGSSASTDYINSPYTTPIFVNYFDLQDFGASPSNTWYALNSTSTGTNTGWNFSYPSVGFLALLR